jgi:prophage regulatory protein
MNNEEFKMALIRLAEVKEYTGLGRSSIYKYMSEGNFPKSVLLGERAIAWVDTEIEEWVQEKIEQRDAEESNKHTTEKTAKVTEADVITFLINKFKQLGISEAITWLMQVLK